MRALVLLPILGGVMWGATFGTSVGVVGGATDLALDEARGRLYVVNNSQQRVDVFTTTQPRLVTSIPVDPQPLSAAMSRDGRYLYVTAYGASLLDVIDLETQVVVRRVSMPAAPEGVAVGGDGRVLITTVGSGTNNADNRLLLFDPNSTATDPLLAVAVTLPAPAAPQSPAPSSRVFMATRSNLTASADGNWIIGLNNPNNTSRQLFVFEVSSGSVLRSRTVTSISNVLSVSADGSRFMAGLSLFDASTLAIVAQQNAANSMYPFQNGVNFNTQQNQGGSVFSPDGKTVYSAFNIAPVQQPAAQASVTQMMLSDSENLLIQMGLQLPENLTGNMVISAAGDVIYALSQSGFLMIPIGRMGESPIAVVDQAVTLLLNDQCGVTKSRATAQVQVTNAGKGRMTATAQVLQSGTTFTTGINQAVGGTTNPGAGGGGPGGGVVIVLPVGPGNTGGGPVTLPPNNPSTTNPLTTTQQTGVTQTAPSVSARNTDTGTQFTFTYNANAARSLGTTAPVDFLIQSNEAINIPFRVRAYQNNRNAEAPGTIVPIAVSVSTAEGLTDIVQDAARGKLYIANSGLNRVEVFDTVSNTLLGPIKVGQLPRSLAMTPDGRWLYVANTGGESVSIIDLEQGRVVDRVQFPPVPYNASFALVTPSSLAATLAGVQVVMSDGTLWKIVGNQALPRRLSAAIGTSTVTAPRAMVATPEGNYALLLGGTGTAYLFDAMSDDYVLSQSVVSTPIQGYFGPMTAGPRGSYYVVNGKLLNATLTPIVTAGVASTRPVAATAAVSATMMARFSQPVISSATAALRDVPAIEYVDATTGVARASVATPEGPLSTQTGTQRVNMNPRGMVVDTNANVAYLLTASGLSVVALPAVSTAPGPGGPGGGTSSTALAIKSNGVVNLASQAASFAPNTLISIYGQNLASSSTAASSAPTLAGGTCVTLDEVAIPLLMTGGEQINAQLPVSLTAGRHTLVVRSADRNQASASYSITTAKYAPAVMLDTATKMAAIYRENGSVVTNSNKANRDELLHLFAIGLGATKGGTVKAGEASPSSPLALTDTVQVFFGDPKMKQSEMIVEWSGLEPGLIGMYRVDVRVPGFHTAGSSLPVTLRIGGVDSPSGGSTIPLTGVN
ncbi:MAG: beta-propeller fold lactonase family protein [Acidobacteria bacterium]|nr:beta-propeller fold lactonase family protein [Acidobacteriota bacterium]